jgi:hypothetical protein
VLRHPDGWVERGLSDCELFVTDFTVPAGDA